MALGSLLELRWCTSSLCVVSVLYDFLAQGFIGDAVCLDELADALMFVVDSPKGGHSLEYYGKLRFDVDSGVGCRENQCC